MKDKKPEPFLVFVSLAIGALLLVMICVAVDGIGDSINKNIDSRIEKSNNFASRVGLDCLEQRVSSIDKIQDREIDRLTRLVLTEPKDVQKKVEQTSDTFSYYLGIHSCCSK